MPNNSYVYINGDIYNIIKFNRLAIGDSIVQDGSEKLLLKDLSHRLKINLDNNRVPVLAYGANASNIQLKSKYKNFKNVVIPVVQSKLIDFDVVYTPYICYDGSIPATIQYSPKTECNVYVTYLTEEQLKHMHKTECIGEDYNYVKLFNIQMVLDVQVLEKEIYSYNSLHGCFHTGENHIALKCIKAINRKFLSMSEEELLLMVKNKLGISKTLDEFILDNINNPTLRNKTSERLAEMSREFQYNDWVVLDGDT
ncbi:hypothetical protein [Vallitalea okinawensis]|uniref:hypothetical protein n=1 Tax=Vallitalea okinawensis TaxID=2078660 RepID=UPI001478DFE2|nr:hypothetical protein [Vallitalea okinawensis]